MVRHLKIINNNLTAKMLGDMKLRNGFFCGRLHMTSFTGVDLKLLPAFIYFFFFTLSALECFPERSVFLAPGNTRSLCSVILDYKINTL